jgi:acyl carrier protein
MAETAAQTASRPARRGGANRGALLTAEPQERHALLEGYLREQLARVLGLSPANLDLHQPLNRLGLDSLMAVEMKNRIELDIGVLIPIVRLLQGPSLAQVAEQLARQLMVGDDAVDRPASASTVAAPQSVVLPEDLITRIDQMSDEEVESLLNSMIMEKEGIAE